MSHVTDTTLQSAKDSHARPQMNLLEYDERFSVFKEFVYYDFEQPTRLPGSCLHYVQKLLLISDSGTQREVRSHNTGPSFSQQRLPDKG